VQLHSDNQREDHLTSRYNRPCSAHFARGCGFALPPAARLVSRPIEQAHPILPPLP